ncbi:uncharacterized protein EI97DRAFT_456284 [Westerdykella ornata]|uniref:Uncharacterized protein n=1 Tax=Westerdykella ornata TaxID=318751 RepID=A0A6A6JSX9_WESOR|nr:uncharacterized protein EI97DRAFT_456284 [Westerdykella ornata]KAF2278846.1 hypothetical protein EI97DRAFT_456284 [Westerdykella ornata]
MAPRFVLPKRLPIHATFAGKRTPALARLNSQSTVSKAAQVVEMAQAVERPNLVEASVPVMWLLSGAAIFAAFNRIESEDHVEKLLIV